MVIKENNSHLDGRKRKRSGLGMSKIQIEVIKIYHLIVVLTHFWMKPRMKPTSRASQSYSIQ